MKNIIIAVTLTLIIALSQMLSGCSPNYDGIIADSTKAIEKNRMMLRLTVNVRAPGKRKATMTKLSPTTVRL
jgi:hypothetical protein